MEKLQIIDTPTPQRLDFWFSGCQWKWNSGIRNGCHLVNMHLTEKFQITDPLKVWVSGFPSVDGSRVLVLAIMEKIEKWPPFHIYASYRKISNY